MLSIEPEGEAQVSFEECVPLATYGLEDVLVQEGLVAGLSMSEGVWPATVWLVDQDGTLVASASELYLATDTLVQQLATTQGFTVEVAPQLRAALDQAKAVFAVSDEFGFVPLIGNAEAAETLKKNLDSLFKG